MPASRGGWGRNSFPGKTDGAASDGGSSYVLVSKAVAQDNLTSDEFLSERVRAEDIILGSLGYGEEATIVAIETTDDGFKGRGRWQDGEEFTFESSDALTDLERWALSVLVGP